MSAARASRVVAQSCKIGGATSEDQCGCDRGSREDNMQACVADVL